MRREYDNQSLPKGLVFYAPLTQGDLSDHISGVVGRVGSLGRATWNDTEEIYEFYCSGSNSGINANSVGLLFEGSDLRVKEAMYDENPNTVMVYGKVVTYSGNGYSAFYELPNLTETLTSNNQAIAGRYANYNCLARYGASVAKNYHWFISRVNPAILKMEFLLDGVVKTTYNTWGSESAPHNHTAQSIAICQKHHNNTSLTFRCRDLMVFDHWLSDDEIRNIIAQ